MAQVHLLFGGGREDIREIAATLCLEEKKRDDVAHVSAGLVAIGDAAAALELLPKQPQEEYARFVFASALLRAEPERFLAEGVPILDQLLETNDQELGREAAWMRAGAALLQKPASESEEALRILEQRDPVRARIHRAAVAERSDSSAAETILAGGGEQPELLIERGRLAAGKGDWEEAIALYGRALELDATPINKLAFADALREAGKVVNARQEAVAIARRGDYPPHIRSTAYALAYELVQAAGELEAQAELAEEWLNFDEGNVRLLWSYIWSLARLARYRDARSIIDRRGLWPSDEADAELFADVLIHTSPPEQALEQLLKLGDELTGEVHGIEGRLAMLALSADARKVPPELMERAVQRLQAYPERFPGRAIETFEVDPADPLRDMKPRLEERARAVAEVSEALTEGETLLAALAATTGRDIGGLLLGLNRLPIGLGNTDIDAAELQNARDSIENRIVWESTAINIAGGLGPSFFATIRAAFRAPAVAQAVVDDARLGAQDAMTTDPSGTLGLDPSTGEVFYHEYAPGT
jgi:tetratricopeptide (TPR) repeat protein